MRLTGRTFRTGLSESGRWCGGAEVSAGLDRVWGVGLRFDVLGAFAVGVGGAAPELAVGLAGGAAAYGFFKQRAEECAG